MFREVKHRKPGQCSAYGCSNPIGIKTDRFCHKHRHRYQKANSPLVYHYKALKQNARRRNKIFTITLDHFKEFCDETGYLELKGRLKKSATIDRIKNELGYIPGNLQVLTLAQNASKGTGEDCPF